MISIKNSLFRLMEIEDVPRVMDVELASFSVPWKEEAFYSELLHNKFAKYFVLENDEKIIGYCGMWFVVDEVHITNIAILPECRGWKLGEALLTFVMEYAISHGATSMTLEVRLSNTPAQGLYRKLGFENGGIRKNYYSDNQEDALVMWVKLDE
ncbi:ribosomal protein S18-alanine N-acetyltransferase [Bacillus sp. 2205SS5-2]|uniref:ribosomal protein S18-alanine N-acetyltransferase n=1 Tax=Bacillus sp. 2205SS5-2 TaxID=3109031 RepID=UPI003005EE69